VPFKYSPGVVDALEPSLDETLIGYLENQKDFLLQEGFLRNDIVIADFVSREPLAEARRIVDLEERTAAA